MNMSRVKAGVGAVAVVVLVAACGGSGGSADDVDGSASSAPSSSSDPTPSGSSSDRPTTVPGSTPTPTPPGVSEPPPSPPPASPVPPDLGVLVGIPERGVETGCIVMDGYLLMGGDRDLLLSGQELRITGGVEKVMTTCQQGIPFRVDSATPVDP